MGLKLTLFSSFEFFHYTRYISLAVGLHGPLRTAPGQNDRFFGHDDVIARKVLDRVHSPSLHSQRNRDLLCDRIRARRCSGYSDVARPDRGSWVRVSAPAGASAASPTCGPPNS